MGNIGIKGVDEPKEKCSDIHCPFHGNLKTRGRIFEGEVVGSKMAKTIRVKWERLRYLKKYERYMKVTTRISAHNPPCINAKEGDRVKIMETRPISKTKSFVVIKIMGE